LSFEGSESLIDAAFRFGGAARALDGFDKTMIEGGDAIAAIAPADLVNGSEQIIEVTRWIEDDVQVRIMGLP
jgi:hypothetical protein